MLALGLFQSQAFFLCSLRCLKWLWMCSSLHSVFLTKTAAHLWSGETPSAGTVLHVLHSYGLVDPLNLLPWINYWMAFGHVSRTSYTSELPFQSLLYISKPYCKSNHNARFCTWERASTMRDYASSLTMQTIQYSTSNLSTLHLINLSSSPNNFVSSWLSSKFAHACT